MNRQSYASVALSILAAVAFTSCSAGDDLENAVALPASGGEITFRVDNAPAPRTSPRAMTADVTDFKVSAIDHGAAYFASPIDVFPSGNGSSWTASSALCWPDGSLTFVAYVDNNPEGSSFRIDGGKAYFSGYEVAADIRDQSELMYAVASDVARDSSDGAVDLSFRHALARISFTARNDDPRFDDVEILSIELGGVKGSGTYAFPPASTSGSATGTWTIDSDAPDRTFILEDTECAMHMIPQTLSDGAYIKVTARMTPAGPDAGSYIEERTIPVSADWKEGERYSYDIAWSDTPVSLNIKVADFDEVTVNADL